MPKTEREEKVVFKKVEIIEYTQEMLAYIGLGIWPTREMTKEELEDIFPRNPS